MLTTWKEIAAFFEVDMTTVQRWERERRLPVHRHSHRFRSSVYAFPHELEAWRATQESALPESPARPASNAARVAVVLAGAAALAAGIGVVLRLARPAMAIEPPVGVAWVEAAGPLAIRSLDDVDGDGQDDLIVHPDAGSEVLVYLGSPGSRPSWQPDVRITSDVPQLRGGSVGDIDGDGLADLVVNILLGEPEAYTTTGPSYLIRGRKKWPNVIRVPDDADTRFDFPSGDIRMGVCVTPGGVDLNGDGLRDIVLGGPDFSPPGLRSAGGVFVLFGRPAWPPRLNVVADATVAIHGSRDGEALGAVCAAGDFTADGRVDLALVATEHTLWNMQGGRGRVYLFEGRNDWPSLIRADENALMRLTGAVERSSISAPLLRDLNGDGAADLTVGFSHAAGSGSSGRVVTVFGTNSPRAVITEDEADLLIRGQEGFGHSIAAVDFNRDGRTDLIVTDPASGDVMMFIGRERFIRRGLLAAFSPDVLSRRVPGAGPFDVIAGIRNPGAIVFEMTDGKQHGIRRIVRLTASTVQTSARDN